MNKIQFGTVSEIWGKAWVRQPQGGFRMLLVGDVLVKGDVVLTAQNAIVRIDDSDARPDATTVTRLDAKPGDVADTNRVIDAVNNGEPREAPAAGLAGGDGGALEAGFRVERIAELLTPVSLELPRVDGEQREIRLVESNPPPELTTGSLTLSPTDLQAFEQGPNVAVGLTAPSGTTGVRIDAVPLIGQLVMANGTPVTAGATLTPAQLSGLVYVPPADYLPGTPVGTIRYTVSNGPSVATGVVHIDVIAVNDAPVAVAGGSSGNEDSTIPVALLGTDVDGAIASVVVDRLPTFGTLLLADGVTAVTIGQSLTPAQASGLLFRPDANQFGTTSIGFAVTDDAGAVSSRADWSLGVAAVDDAPSANPDGFTVAEDGSVSINVLGNDSDAEGSPLTITHVNGLAIVDGGPAVAVVHGSVQLVGGQLVFTPAPDYNGPATFSYTVSDGVNASTASVSGSVAPVGDAPVAGADSFTVTEDGSVSIDVRGNDTDVDGDTLTVTQVNGSAIAEGGTAVAVPNGSVQLVGGQLVFTPAPNYSGPASFTYTVSDGSSTAAATVSGSVTAVNDAPVIAVPPGQSTSEDGALVFSSAGGNALGVADVDGDPLTVTVTVSSGSFTLGSTAGVAVSGDGSGSVTLSGSAAAINAALTGSSFNPNPDFNGAATLSLSASDGTTSAAGSVTIGVVPVVDITSDAVTTDEDTPIAINVLANDSFESPIASVTAVNGQAIVAGGAAVTVANGTVALNALGQLVFTPAANYNNTAGGPTSFSYTVSSGGTSETANVVVTVNPVADTATVSLSASASVAEGGSIIYTATLTDAALAPVTVALSNGASITIAAGATSGSVVAAAPSDDVYIDAGSVSTTIGSATGGGFDTLIVDPAAAVSVITDTLNPTTLSLTASPSVAEGGTIVYTASLTSAAQTPVSVTLSNGATITIAAGASSGAVNVPAPADDTIVDAGSVSATIGSASGGNFENLVVDPAAATTVVTDTIDTTTVSLTATPSVAEGGAIVYTASLTGPAQTPVSITLSNGATIVIAAGASTGTVSVAAPADDAIVDAGNVSATISSATGGGFENLAINATPALTSITDTLDTTTVSLTATPSVAEGGAIVYTASLTSPADTPVTVTLSNGATITIAAGASSGTVSVAAPGDDVYIDAGTVSATISSATGGNFENLTIDPAPATTTVTDTIDTTTVSLSATPSVAEGGAIVYTASLTSPADTPVTVTLSNGATISIAAGASSGTVSVAAPGDDMYIDAGTVTATISSATGGNFENLVVNAAPATTSVTDTLDTTTVSLTGTASVAEGASASYTVSLTSPAQTAVAISLNYSGTAVNGVDFSGVATVTIAAGASSATFSVATIDDALAEGAESFTIALSSATGGNFENLVISGVVNSVVSTITDDDTALISVSDSSVVESGFAVFTVGLSVPSATPITFMPTLGSGTATVGTDTATTLEYFDGSAWVPVTAAGVTLAAGQTSVQVRVATLDDAIADSGETFTLTATVTAGTTGNPSATGTATISDEAVAGPEDTTDLSLSGSASVAEGGNITYSATLTNPANAPMTITLSNGAVIVIAAGASSGSVSVPAPADDAYVDAGSFSATIATATGGAFENLVVSATPATTAITDTIDITTVSLTATPAVAEGGAIVYTAALTGPADTPVTVTLSNGATISIAAGASSGSVSVAAPGDDVYLDAGSVSVQISTASGGNFEQLTVDAAPAVTVVGDTIDTTTVSLTATPSVAEGGSILYTASLAALAQSTVTVTLDDGRVITIAAGTSSGSISVPAPSDDVYVDGSTIARTINSAAGGNFENLAISAAPAVTTITDTVDATTVSLTATPSVAEGGSILYTASLTAAAQSSVVVTLDDGTQITIAAGASSGSVSVAAPSDDVYVDGGSITHQIASASGGNFEQLTINAAPAVTTITDTVDSTTVSLAATPSVAEGGSILYTASLTAAAQSAVTVTLDNGSVITIAAGSSSGSTSVAAPADDAYVDGITVTAQIVSAAGGNFEDLVVDGTPAATTITDTLNATTVSLTATPSVAEGGSIAYTASLSAPAQSAVTVTLDNGAQITIGAGASSGSISVAAPSDDAYLDGTTVTRQISSASGGNFEQLTVNATPAVTTVTDTVDATTVSLTATPSVAEGGAIVYTASLTAPAQTAVTVTLDDGTPITIAAGNSSGSTSVAAPADDVYVDGSTITHQIVSASGGNFEQLVVDATPAVTTVTDTVDTATVSLTATPSVAEGGAIVYTASLSNPAETPVSITLSNGATIAIAAGASSGSVSVAAPVEDVYVDAGNVSATITVAIGGNFENLAVNPAAATTSVTDTIDTTTVSLTGAASVVEGSTANYTVSLTSPASTAVTVNLSYSGTAADGSDFTGVATVTVPAGSSSASFDIATIDDALSEGVESFTVALSSATGGNFENLLISGGAGSVTTSLQDNDGTPSIRVSDIAVVEGDAAVFVVSLSNASASDTIFTPALDSGTATVGTDTGTVLEYFDGVSWVAVTPAGVTIPAGSLSVQVRVATLDDALAEPAETFTLTATVTAGTTANAAAIGTASISDEVVPDTVLVSIAGPGSVVEGDVSGAYTVSLSQPAVTPVTVNLNYGGTAANGSDYTGVVSVTIPAGASSASFTLPTSDDAVADSGETIVVSLGPISGGGFEAIATHPVNNTVTTTISDEAVPDTTTVSVTATPTVAEGGSISYTATLTNPAQTPVTVTLSNGATIVIAAGASSGSVSVAAPGEDVYVDAGNVSVTINTASGGNFENLTVNGAPAITAVTDTIDGTTVSLSATPSVAEGGSIVYTASLTHPAETPVSITLSNGATIAIAAGASSGNVSVAAPTDDVYLDAGNLSATITSATGGNFENLTVDAAPAVTAITDTVNATTVSLTASPSVAEGGSIIYTASLTSPAQTPVTVTLSNGATITIAANASSGTVSVAAPADDAYVDAGNVSATISSATGGNFESLVVNPAAAVTTVTDTIDTTTVSLTASPSVAEGGSIVYTASLTHPAETPVSVTLSNGATISIAAGASSGTVSVAAPADDVYVDAGSVSTTISTATGGNFENLVVNPAAAVTAVTDTINATTVSLTASPSVAEGGSIVYTASLTGPAQSPVTVTLSNGATITIAANASSGTVSVAAPADDAYVDAGNVSATISNATGGNFESLAINPAAATTAVTDTIDTTTVSLTATPSVAEGGSITYTASLTQPADTAMSVTLSNGATINIAAGAASGSVSVAAPADDAIIDAGSVSATISSATGGNFESLAINPAAAVTAVTDTIDTTTVSLTASPSVAEGGSIVYTASLTSAADTPVSITLSNGATITIAAGAASGTVSVAAPSDDAYVDAGNVSATISTATGGNFENLVVDPAAAATAVSDTIDTTIVSLSGDASVAEGAAASYTVSLTGPADTAVTVTLTYSGTAVDGVDFTGVATVTIPAGASSASFNVATLSDTLAEGAESFTVALASASGGNFENLVLAGGAGSSVTTGIVDDDVSLLSLGATPNLTEAGGTVVYTATLTQAPITPLTVSLSNGATIVIAAGLLTGSTNVAVPASDDVYIDPTSVSASIASTSGGGIGLVVDATPAVTTIGDTIDTTTVSLAASPSVAEGGTIVYTASLDHAAQTAVSVTLSNGATIAIAAGASSGTVSVAAPTDDVYVDAGSVSTTISTATGGNFESLVVDPAAAVTAVTDTINATTVSLTATPSVAEGGSIVYTASLTSPAQTPVTVTLANGATILIAAGASSGTVSVAAPADDVHVDAGTVSTTISSATGGNFENLAINPAAATTSVTDTIDTTTVSLTATPSVAEGGSITYTASLTQPADTAVSVTLSNGATISVAAGASSGTVSVAAPTDDVYVDAGSVSTTISTATGGNFENLVVNPAAAVTAVTDTVDTTTVTLSASPIVAEGGSITYTATLNHVAQTPVVVTLSNGATITIAAGAGAGTVSLAAPGDDAIVDAGNVSATISTATGGNFENLVVNPAPAVTSVTDTIDTTTVSLTATASVAEGGSIIYTASLTSAAQTPVTVILSNGATITVAAGASSGTANVAAPSDDAIVDAGSVSATISSAAGGDFENLTINPAAAITTVTDTIDTTTVSLAATPSVAEGGSIVYTASLTSAADTPVSITLSNGATITIAAGASSGSVSVAAPPDDPILDAGTVSATISTATGGNFENLAINPAAATTAVTDTLDATTVTLTASPSVAEGDNITYTASLTSAAQTPVTVALANGATITIAAGASSGSVSVAAPGDDAYVDAGSVSTTIVSASGGNFESLLVNPAAASTTITDTIDVTSVSLAATASVAEGGSITYTASLTHAADTAVAITLSNGATINIAAGASSGTVSVPAPGDDAIVDAGSVSTTIVSASGGNFESLSVNPTPAVTTITDTIDATTLSLTATPTVAEGGSIVYTASLNHAADTAMTVTLSNGATISIAAGATSGTVSVAAPADDVIVDAGNVSATIGSTTGGNFENLVTNPAPAVTAVTDTIDLTTLSLTGSANVVEGTSGSYTVSLTGPAGTAVTVNLAYSGTAANGVDYTGVASVTIPAGASSATFSIATLDDALAESGENFTVSLASASGGNFENLALSGTANAVTTAITDEAVPDTVLVSIAGPAGVVEGATTGVYTVSLSQAAATDVTVNLNYGGTATGGGNDYTGVVSVTIPAGSTSATFTLPTTNDVLDEADETVVVSLGGISGGGFEAIAAHPVNNSVTTTITDNDPTPSLVINDVSVNEAAGTATFTVTLSAVSGQTVSVNYATGGGTATAGSDYTAASGTLTFTPGVLTQTITVPIVNDTATESSETFNVTLAGAINATIADNTGVGTIIDNDAPPVLDLDANNSSGAAGANYATSYTEQGSAVAISDVDIAITDVDSSSLAGATITLTNRQSGDVLNLPGLPPGITANVNTTATQITITLSGTATLAQYQSVISGITFAAGGGDAPDTTARTVTVGVTDGTSSSNLATSTITVVAVNDAPVNAVPGVQTTAEDTSKAITGLSISDVDAGSGTMTVTLAVTNGTMAVTGGTATIANSGTSTVTLTGTAAQINATLAANVTYVPTANFNGAATLTMTTSDGGNFGTGGTLTDIDTVGITVTAVNDAPVNTVPASIAVTEDAASPITGISVSDVDSGSGTISVTLSVPAGVLAATSGSGVTVTGSGTGSLVLSGTQANINGFIAASAVTYTTAANANGSVTLTVTTSDLGNAGSGGTLTDVDTVTLNIAAVNDAPVNTVPAAQTTNEDTSKAITGLSIADIDGGSGAMTVTLAVTNGTLSVAGGSAAIAGSGTSTVTLTGTIAQINATLGSSVSYAPTANFGGTATLTMTTNDGGNTGSGGALSDVDTVTINVTAVADQPTLLVPSAIDAIVAGVNTISTAAAITAANLTAAIGLPTGSLNAFDPAAGPGTNDPGNVTAFNGAISNYNYNVIAGTAVSFKWTFTNGENLASEINNGFNDMAVVTITAPDGTQTSQLITASETLGPSNNGAGTYTFTAPTNGNYQFSWFVINGSDANKNSSVAITDVSMTSGGHVVGAIVDVPLLAQLGDTDGSESLSVQVTGVPAGSWFSSGTDHGGGVWTFSAPELNGLKFLAADGLTGTVNLSVTATSTEASNGATATTAAQAVAIVISQTTNTITGTSGTETLAGTANNDHIQGLAGVDTINAGAGNDLVHGGAGNDVISGQDGNDVLYGDAGNDTLDGGNGNDVLVGGKGNDTLTGGAGADVFRWELGDAGTAGTPATDTVADFNNAVGGDKLDLRDLLTSETTGTLSNYLHFSTSGGNTVISISTTGAFAAGFSSGAVDQTITLNSVNLVGSFTSDQQIIQDLLNRGKLIADPGP